MIAEAATADGDGVLRTSGVFMCLAKRLGRV
jgi:hypothetical protein